MQAKSKPFRNRALAEIHIIKSKLSLDDGVYRGILADRYGETSAGKLCDSKLRDCLDHFRIIAGGRDYRKHAGMKYSPRSRDKRTKTPADKLRALWIDGHRRGIIKNPDERALDRFVQRITGVAHIGWLKPNQMNTAIEGLKAMLKREGEP